MAPLLSFCRVKYFLGCIPLEVGTYIIGGLAVFGSLMELFVRILVVVDFNLQQKQCIRHEQRLFAISAKKNGTESAPHTSKKCPSEFEVEMRHLVEGLASFLCVLYFLVTLLMLCGAKLRKPKLMVPWLVCQITPVLFTIVALFNPEGPPFRINMMSNFFIIYFFIVIYSYYLELQETGRIHHRPVVAVTQTPAGMTVNIPSPGKDDPPPPYPGFISSFNPAYNPSDATLVPPYGPLSSSGPLMPPPYQEIATNSQTVIGPLMPPSYQEIPGSSQTSQENLPSAVASAAPTTNDSTSDTPNENSPAGSSSDVCRESTPLVTKPPQGSEV